MLIFTSRFTLGPLIRDCKVGFVFQKPTIRICLIEFKITEYKDSLFSAYSIPFPFSLSSATDKRRAEYLAGRIAAKILLAKENIYEAVTAFTDHSPKWPDGWRGSISHTEKFAIVAITPKNTECNVGVDIERYISGMFSGAENTFTTESEQKLLTECGMDYNCVLPIIFSAKESFFKAIYPRVNIFFDFYSVAIIELNTQSQLFTLQLMETLTETFAVGGCYSGYYIFHKNNIITLIY